MNTGHNQSITPLPLIDKDNITLFNDKAYYVIPLYQRAYAWIDKHIEQLIEDIRGKDDGADYFLGSLIVNKNAQGQYEVIDGQQRLTTLFLIFNCLGLDVSKSLSFACREASQKTLENINSLISPSGSSNILEDKLEPHIVEGIQIIQDIFKNKFNDNEGEKEKFINNLHHVWLYRIELPEHTDLNRYFEIMNTRGEQLDPHDIVKARLMSFLQEDSQKRELFAQIWDACSDMNGYVQMNMDAKLRRHFFGNDWNQLPSFSEDSLTLPHDDYVDATEVSIVEIIQNPQKKDVGKMDDFTIDRHSRYESIISFPDFLLHVLRIFKNDKSGGLLDDQKLLDNFDKAVDKKDSLQADFAWGFIQCLLKCRFLFDKYIIKRQFDGDDTNGHWSINELKKSTGDTPYYTVTTFGDEDKSDGTISANANNLMLQSCMRVTYTSPKTMHWITTVLSWLYQDHCSNLNRLEDLASQEEEFIIRSVHDDFLKQGKFELGVLTPHLVFNYLDYLLWKDDSVVIENKDNFTFEFRNSVEHWYPQNPSDKTFPIWDKVDRFGNLCIIQRNVNSRFGNMSPCAKKDTYGNKAVSQSMIWNGSLKLRLMAEATIGDNSWRENDCEKHEMAMLDRLIKACSKLSPKNDNTENIQTDL